MICIKNSLPTFTKHTILKKFYAIAEMRLYSSNILVRSKGMGTFVEMLLHIKIISSKSVMRNSKYLISD